MAGPSLGLFLFRLTAPGIKKEEPASRMYEAAFRSLSTHHWDLSYRRPQFVQQRFDSHGCYMRNVFSVICHHNWILNLTLASTVYLQCHRCAYSTSMVNVANVPIWGVCGVWCGGLGWGDNYASISAEQCTSVPVPTASARYTYQNRCVLVTPLTIGHLFSTDNILR